jgi:ferritin-like metal-binding protein YciE
MASTTGGQMAQISDPKELFAYKLGTALAAERRIHTMLVTMEQRASLPELKQGFARHLAETEGQIRNVEQALEAVGGETTAHPDPVTDGIAEQAEKMLGRVDGDLADAVLLGGATETEHHEIALYEGLLALAPAAGAEDAVPLLEENLAQEQKTLRELEGAQASLTRRLAGAAAG